MEEAGRENAVASGSEGGGGGGGGGFKDTPSPTPSPPLSPPAVATGGGGMGLMAVPETMGPAGMGFPSMMTMMSGGGGEDLARKKRGRPRKYIPDGVPGGVSLTLSPGSSTSPIPFSLTTTKAWGDLSAKRGRGRPPGSGRRQLLASLGEWFAYSAGGNFTPHVVTIATGEDVATRILSFSQKGPRSICILSANGAISNVTLRQPGSSGGTLTFEGRFEILSLSGSFTITEDGGVRSRTGGISVSLAGPDGRVVGGGVAGLLLAASPIQVVVGSFLPNTLIKEHRRKSSNLESSSSLSTTIPSASGVATAARTIFQVIADDDCETPTTSGLLPGQQSQGEAEEENVMGNTPDPNSAPFLTTVVWPGLLQSSSTENKPSPDINISLHGEL